MTYKNPSGARGAHRQTRRGTTPDQLDAREAEYRELLGRLRSGDRSAIKDARRFLRRLTASEIEGLAARLPERWAGRR